MFPLPFLPGHILARAADNATVLLGLGADIGWGARPPYRVPPVQFSARVPGRPRSA